MTAIPTVLRAALRVARLVRSARSGTTLRIRRAAASADRRPTD